jgi:S-DNA-T family DNA segregation ATPase FtsK/SpoIIIE
MVALSDEILVGRRGAAFDTNDRATSSRHCTFAPDAGGAMVTDVGSSNGTFVNGERIAGPRLVAPGDVVRVGNTDLRILELRRRSAPPAGPAVAVLRPDGELEFLAVGDEFVVGRAAEADVRLADGTVSQRHARWHLGVHGWEVEDLSSSNGTFVNGRRITGTVRLAPGDAVSFGTAPTTLTVGDVAAFGSGPEHVRVQIEGAGAARAVSIDADRSATVGAATERIAAYLGVAAGGKLLYRARDGQLLHPDDLWAGSGTRRGDLLVLADGAMPAAARREIRFEPPIQMVSQLPRTAVPPAGPAVDVPPAPDSLSLRGRGLPWQMLGGGGSVIGGLVMAQLNPRFAIMGYLTASIGVAAMASGILAEQSRRRFRRKQYDDRLQSLDRLLETAVAQQRGQFEAVSPTVERLTVFAQHRSPRLWERRRHDEDFGRLRIGMGDRMTRFTLPESAAKGLSAEASAILQKHQLIHGCAVLGPGPEVPLVGVAGERSAVAELANRMILEAALLHPPSLLRVWVVADNPAFAWTRWLPHTVVGTGRSISRSAAEVPDTVAALLRALRGDDNAVGDAFHLVFVAPRVARHAAVARLLDQDVRGRAQVVALAGSAAELPSGVEVVIELGERPEARVLGTYPDAPVGRFRFEGVTQRDAEVVAVEVAALRERADGPRRSAARGLVELVAGAGASARTVDVAATWDGKAFPPMHGPVGVAADGSTLTIGFRPDPHVFVAGTTGSGKSELLQTLLVGMAMLHSPDRLNLFLIDFKGRATFGPLAELPHVVGLLTDLEQDPALAERAFSAVDAEIERRKRILDRVRLPNIIEYEAMKGEGWEPLPNLVVVIDELQKLIEREPDVKRRLDTVASQGRSLGVHLLLATQSPTGVITPTIEANTNLWLCLRVATPAESSAILGAGRDDAARLPNVPGSGYFRQGRDQDLVPFRSARIARPVREIDLATVEITPFVDDPGASAPAATPQGDEGQKEIDLVVERIISAARARAIPPARQLWMPPLPSVFPSSALLATAAEPNRLVARVGMTDLPEVPAQVPWTMDLSASGNGLFMGALGSGKTTALLQVGFDLAATHPPEDLHLYGLEAGGGSLLPLRDLPHTADTVGAGDQERMDRLLQRLLRLVTERRRLMTDAGAVDLLALRAMRGQSIPWVVLLLDDFISFREVADQVDHGRPMEHLTSLVRNGPAVGVHVVVAAAQSPDIRITLLNLFGSRLLLRMTDPTEYYQVGVRARPGEMPELPAGRGFAEGARAVQVALPGPEVVAAAQGWTCRDGEAWPRPIPTMPTEIRLNDVLRAADPAGAGVVIGVGGPEVAPVNVDVADAGGVLAVVGPNQSGRTTALATFLKATLLHDPGTPFAVIATRRGPLREATAAPGCIGFAGTPPEAPELLERFVEAPSGAVLVIDDAEALGVNVGPLEQVLRQASDRGHVCLIASRARDLQTTYEPWSKYLISLRTALLLQPTGDDAFMFGAKLPTGFSTPPPGRALLLTRSSFGDVQVALP